MTADGGRPPRPLIRFEGVTKRFGATPALDDLTLEIRDGEFFCLLGPSGCGKSTLLRLLAGFEAADAGRVLLDGRDLAGVPPHRRALNMMFQSYALFPHLTVADNIAYGLRREGLSRALVAARTAEMLDLVQLGGMGERHPAQLSGGQSQRVALARALARKPRVLLLDEPLGALDRRLREETQIELKALQARLGTTFVMVTHDQSEAMAMADRIGVMAAGRVVQAASPRVVYERPATRFVAGFVGEVNLIEGRIVGRDGDGWRVATPLAAPPLTVAPDGAAPGLADGTPVSLAVRPERMTLVPPGAAPGPNAFPGEIVDIAYLGPTTALRVRHASGQVLRVTAVTGDPSLAPRLAGEVMLGFAPGAAVLLAE